MGDTFLDKIDKDRLDEEFEKTDNNVSTFQNICDGVVNYYSSYLDELMIDIKRDIVESEDVDTNTLEKYFLKLTNQLYFMGIQVETLGVYDDLSEISAKEEYNEVFIKSQGITPSDIKSKATVAERQAIAEEAAKYGFTVNSIYNRAYKVIKFKIESAQEMVKTLSKVLSKRMTEMQLDITNKGRI